MNLWTFLMGGSVFLGLFLAVSVLVGRERGPAAYWLSLLLGSVAAFLMEFLLMQRGYYALPVVFVTFPLVFAMGPALWFLSRSLMGERVSAPVAVLHLSPVLLTAANQIPYYADIVSAGSARGLHPETLVHLGGYEMMAMHLGQLLVYVVMSARLLRRLVTRQQNVDAGPVVEQARTVFRVALGLGALIGIQIALVLVMKTTGHHIDEAEYAMACSLSLILLYAGWSVSRQPKLVTAFPSAEAGLVPAESTADIATPSASAKYVRSRLDPATARDYRRRLVETVEGSRAYLDADLSLTTLARSAGIPPHRVTQILNQELGVTFYDYINAHRVRSAAERLLNPRDPGETVLAVAFESGFSSKASFNRAFKQHTGMTPTEFRERGQTDDPLFRTGGAGA